MKDIFLALLLVVCGMTGLALVHKKDDPNARSSNGKPMKSKTILIKAINDHEHSDGEEIKVLDGNNIHISNDSTDFAFQG